MDKLKIHNTLVDFIIITLSVSPAFALADDNKNLLLIGAMAILIPFVFILNPTRISKIDLTLISLCLFIVCIFILVQIIIQEQTPTAMDVYQGKTTIEITYKDGVPVDSTVVWKSKQ